MSLPSLSSGCCDYTNSHHSWSLPDDDLAPIRKKGHQQAQWWPYGIAAVFLNKIFMGEKALWQLMPWCHASRKSAWAIMYCWWYLTHWGLNKMAGIVQMAFSNEFLWKTTNMFWIECHKICLCGVKLTVIIGSGNGLALNRQQAIILG